MLSYKTITAIQVLHVLHDAECGLTISNVKLRARLSGVSVGQTAHQLARCGWLDTDSRSRYSMTEHARNRTLYDLVLAMDGTIILGTNVDPNYVTFWGAEAKESIPHTISFNEGIKEQFVNMLRSVTIMELITK